MKKIEINKKFSLNKEIISNFGDGEKYILHTRHGGECATLDHSCINGCLSLGACGGGRAPNNVANRSRHWWNCANKCTAYCY